MIIRAADYSTAVTVTVIAVLEPWEYPQPAG